MQGPLLRDSIGTAERFRRRGRLSGWAASGRGLLILAFRLRPESFPYNIVFPEENFRVIVTPQAVGRLPLRLRRRERPPARCLGGRGAGAPPPGQL